MEWLSNPQSWISLLTLIALELVLGVDNVIFISILAGKLPLAQQARARMTGIGLAIGTRILLLLSLSWLVGLTASLFELNLGPIHFAPSGRDLILLVGGLFLIAKSTREIHEKLEGEEHDPQAGKAGATFTSVIIQILLLDIVFSLDSVITAVGMANEIVIMVIAVIVAAVVMVFAAGSISDFVNKHPTIKMLALSFLLLIGFTLTVEAFHFEIPKGYIYFAMAFSVFVELLNIRLRNRKKVEPVELRGVPHTVSHSGK